MIRIRGAALLALWLVAGCGGGPAPAPHDDVPATWTAGDDAPLDGASAEPDPDLAPDARRPR